MTTRVLTPAADLTEALIDDARRGLSESPRWLPPKYFYDERGSELFDQITLLPEYYPTRAERALLTRYSDEIARAADARVLLELGSGSSYKTTVLLDALDRAGQLESYVPVDVSASALGGALDELARSRPTLQVYPVVADFEHHLSDLPAPGRRLVAFLGSTIGNFAPDDRTDFFARLGQALRPGETFLLGVDLVKDPARLVAAYDDAGGVTAEFNRNVLRVLNRELGGDVVPDDFEHVAVWDAEHEWIEMRLRARRAMSVRLPRAELAFDLAAGEEIRTEISAKFRRLTVESELVAAGFRPLGWWTDGDFALALARN